MVFFSLDRYSTSSPSPTSKSKFISSWISELDDNPDQAKIDSLPLTPSKQTHRKSVTSPKPLQTNPNLCTRSVPSFPYTKHVLGKRKNYAMDPQEQSAHQESPRRSGRTKSPSKKVLDNVAASSSIASVTAKQPVLTATSNIPLRSKSPVKPNKSPRKPQQDLRGRTREDDDDDESENNVFSKLPPVKFDPTRENTTQTRSSSPNRERAEMIFYNPSIEFLSVRSSDHPQDVTDFMFKFKSTLSGQAVIPEYFSVWSLPCTKFIKLLFR